MSDKYRYDVYRVSVPLDAAGDPNDLDWESGEADRLLGDIAIDEARERARLYCLPAVWTAERIRDDDGWEATFRVTRKRFRKAGAR